MSAPRVDEATRGRARWLLWPSIVANLVCAALAAYYASLTLQIEGESRSRFLMLLAAASIAFVLNAEVVSMRRLRTLRQLGTGRLAGGPAQLVVAMKEVIAAPDSLRVLSMGSWLGTMGCVAVGMKAWCGSEWSVVFRLVAIGLTFGPLSSVLVYLMVTPRARELVERLSTFLSAAQVIASIPHQRQQLRARLVAFTVIMVILPSAMMADLGRSRSQAVFDQVRAAPIALALDVGEQARGDARTQVVSMGALLLLLALAAAWLAGNALAGPMRAIAEEANRITRGELREPRVIVADDEVWAVSATFTLMQAQLFDVVAQLQKAGMSIGVTTEELMATSSKYETGAADQAAALNETSATTEELAQSARQISHNASNVSDIAQKTLEAARGGQASADAFAAAVERMKQDNRAISDAVIRLQKRVQQIGKIVEFITGVADRSDLLALSAELEGTKAGEVGRGFSLVAAEMRRLAENVIESTNEIEELIGEIREATLATVEATGQGLEQTESGTALAGHVTQSLAAVVDLAQRTSDSVRAISLATQQQQTSTDQLAEAMADILAITQTSLAATKQVTSANHELITLAASLKSIVQRFKAWA